jgi:hypothetical protein
VDEIKLVQIWRWGELSYKYWIFPLP